MARERSEATDSLDRFTVRMPAAIRTIIACCAVVFELIMLGVYVWQGVSLGEWDHELVWFGHAMALVFSLVIAFMAVFTDAGARLLLLVPCLFLFIGGLLPLLMLSMPARGIYEIGRQERELGFSFAEEMTSRGATGPRLSTTIGSSRSATPASWRFAAIISRRSRRTRIARAATVAR